MKSLPSVPGVALRIVELSQQPEVDALEIVEVLSRDPALTVKVLAAANSPAFAHRRKAANLREAVLALGIEATLTLSLGFTLLHSLQSGPGRLDCSAFWRRAVVCGAAAQCIGIREGRLNSEELLLAGMLQDLGMLVFDAMEPRAYGRLAGEAGNHEALRLAEIGCFGVDHAELGSWLMERWNLPDYLRQAAAGSHEPERSTAGCGGDTEACPELELMRVVALSSRMADVWVTEDPEAATVQAAALAHRYFGWEQALFGEVLEMVTTAVKQLIKVYEVDIQGGDELNRISEQAREVLTLRSLNMIHEAAQVQRRSQELEAQNSILKQQAERDPLTELHNRRHLAERLQHAFERAGRARELLAVALIDLDHFKSVNDEFGHQAGDAVLYGVAKILRSSVRKQDILARYGGEEFLIALPGLGELAVRGVLERLRQAIADHPHDMGGTLQRRHVTASIGYALYDPNNATAAAHFSSIEALIRGADEALYRAKSSGRNRVEQEHPS